ncbi:hypothetical protein [Phormidium sp. FACHB-77]|nr:hypothetical protein [Phormidium sp. FACHB-77]MBD1919334.1 hypothetical protein [Phormidium sp. FACHB-77]
MPKIQLAIGDSFKATTYIEFVQTVMQMDRASKLHSFMLEGMNIQGATG